VRLTLRPGSEVHGLFFGSLSGFSWALTLMLHYRPVCSTRTEWCGSVFAINREGEAAMTPGQLRAVGAAVKLSEPTGSVASNDDYADVAGMCSDLSEAADDDERRRLRCRIVTRCLPLADHIAYRFVGRGESADDLIQIARLGLIKAIDRYDPSKGQLLAFLVPTIMGDVRRHFRDNTWGMHVPRKLKDTHRRVRATSGPLAQRLGRAPTASDLAAELGIDYQEVVQAVDAAYAYRPLSLDAGMPDSQDAESFAAYYQPGADDPRFASVEDAVTVAALVGRLAERERVILALRFCEDLPQSQIARRLGISQVHVSRLLSATLERLRQYFWDDAAMR
jgi:RNA polymerase sigma-B factor